MRPDRGRHLARGGPGNGGPGDGRRRDDDRFRAGGRSGDAARLPLDAGPTDPDLDAVTAELARAGSVARAAELAHRTTAPRQAFAADLRARLLGELPVAAPVAAAATVASSMSGPVPAEASSAATSRAEGVVGSMPIPRRIFPQLSGRAPTLLPAPRWTALAAAAVIVLSVVGVRNDPLPAPPSVRAGAASAAILIRDGLRQPLRPGTGLEVGDEVRVERDGYAVVQVGASQARMAGGSDLRIDVASAERVVLDQIAGRVFHRVIGPADRTYTVETASVEWTASGTAFDVDRQLVAGGQRVVLAAIHHDVVLSGPDLRTTITEGRQAIVLLGGEQPDLATGDMTDSTLADPWFEANARTDLALGNPLGVLARLEFAEASPLPTDEPVEPTAGLDTPSGEPVATAPGPVATAPPTAAPTARPTPRPTPKPTPRPTPGPTPRPTPAPTPTLGSMALTATACPGGVLLDWGQYAGDAFGHYLVLRSAGSTIPAVYPPPAGVSGVEGGYSEVVARTDGFDPTDGGGTLNYRAIAFSPDDRALAASPVRAVATKAVKNLGPLAAGPDGGTTAFGWTPFGGGEACFSYYKLAYSESDATPSYLDGAAVAWVGSDQAAGEAFVADLAPGTYWFRMQAIRATSLGKFVVGQTDAVAYTVP